jgi:hypothetical protein
MSEGQVIGAALLRPGFYPPNTVWRLTIDGKGLLRQEVQIRNYQKTPSNEFLCGESKLTNLELEGILDLAHQVGFAKLSDRYEDWRVTSQATFWLAVRFETYLKTVEAYAPAWCAARGQTEMVRFLELWDSIHRFAPFPCIFKEMARMVAAEVKLQSLMRQ